MNLFEGVPGADPGFLSTADQHEMQYQEMLGNLIASVIENPVYSPENSNRITVLWQMLSKSEEDAKYIPGLFATALIVLADEYRNLDLTGPSDLGPPGDLFDWMSWDTDSTQALEDDDLED